MAPTDSALGIVLTVRIEHICSGPVGVFGGEVAAIQDFPGCLQRRECYAVANILAPSLVWPAGIHAPSLAWPTSLESLGPSSKWDSLPQLAPQINEGVRGA